MKTRKKTGKTKHLSKVAASSKKGLKEQKDRIRLGKLPFKGDDLCGEEHLGYKCRRESGHGGKHCGYRLDRMEPIEWKRVIAQPRICTQ